MDTVFITGASGFIGKHLAITLADAGTRVHALVRGASNTTGLQHPNITAFTGDILNEQSLRPAMQGCSKIYHLAGLAKMWTKDKKIYYDVNVTGTDTVLRVARSSAVEKIIVTSTAGTLPPASGHLTNEHSQKQPRLYTTYERTKNEAEDLAIAYFKKGLPVVIAYPTKVYGPGAIDDSNTATMMIRDYIKGNWKIIPGNGKGTMNYVYIDDIVNGLMLAMQRARPGSSYIIGGDNADYDTFFALIKDISGIRRSLYHLPYLLIRSVAWLEDMKAKWVGLKPFITSEWVKKLPYNWSKDISRAKVELHYQPLTLREGIRKTIEWLEEAKHISSK